jgi:hypothetical protein
MSKLTCPVCAQQHDELPALTFEGPTFWKVADPEERKHFELGPDLCRYKDEHYLIRARLQIPVTDAPEEVLEFSVWVAVSKDNWWKYRTTFMDFNAQAIGVFYGWLANAIPGHEDTTTLKVAVEPQGQAKRPLLTLEPTDHAFAQEQLSGVTLDQAMRYLHDRGGF